MGFTIGGMRERGGPRPTTGRVRRGQGRSPMDTAVAEYVGLWGWDVTPGAGLRPAAGRRGTECSCGHADCSRPGTHPLPRGRTIPAGSPLDRALDIWADARAETPSATALLSTGVAFDVLEVPESVARAALPRLDRLAVPLGPVALAPDGRAWFFVAPGIAAELPSLLDRLGWSGIRLRLRGLGAGRHIAAPPSDFAGLGAVGWLRPPDLETAATPPSGDSLLGALASLCHRLAPAD
ncbi:bifunctional DNA primase/polymerase [Streptomyces sp. NBRC 109706]|uniref:bifunctional DNA primase/polymerase n=1 Tax=Streptomyces sp. NBRC 109706 TaxID=1550035 RepID=UPI000785AC98|nr:bifunctional DNA primase/polymerase [Streptomyces sp. NBRC 109706]